MSQWLRVSLVVFGRARSAGARLTGGAGDETASRSSVWGDSVGVLGLSGICFEGWSSQWPDLPGKCSRASSRHILLSCDLSTPDRFHFLLSALDLTAPATSRSKAH